MTTGVDHRVRFGLYEADLQSGELWKAGLKVKLQSQPFKVLVALLERPGQVVTREELQERLWGKQSVGDFDHSLGTAINKIRDALSDTAENPRFVETLARRGYRFIAPVSGLPVEPVFPTAESTSEHFAEGHSFPSGEQAHAGRLAVEPGVSATAAKPRRFAWRQVLQYGVVIAAAAAVTGFYVGTARISVPPRIDRLTITGRMVPTLQSMESLPAAVTDGVRVILPVLRDGRSVLSAIDVHTGQIEPLAMPDEIVSPMLGDLSPDGSHLLLRSHLSPESEQPLWSVPISGGSALRLSNIVAHDATWMPDGESILYAAGNQLIISTRQGVGSTPFATLPGRAFWLRWSPDGKVLRFTLLDPVAHRMKLWQIDKDGRNAHELLGSWTGSTDQCCGVWTGGSHTFVFQAFSGAVSDLWRLPGRFSSAPVRITNGPLNFAAPSAARIGDRIYFLGQEEQSTLDHFDPVQHRFVAEPEFLSQAQRVEYSPDGQWIVWTDQQGRLWRANSAGGELVQVTPDTLQVFLAHWSPNGKSLALMARYPGKAWQLYEVAPTGGAPQRLLPEDRNEADPSWSADGRQLVFGRVTDIMGKENGPRALQVVNLDSGVVTPVPASEGLFSPRWSPDGKFIAALSLDQRRLLLFDVALQTWRVLSDTSVADPVWTSDSKGLFFHASQAPAQPLYKVSIPDGHVEQISTLLSFQGTSTADYFFCGLTPDNQPIVRSRSRTGDLYTLDLDQP